MISSIMIGLIAQIREKIRCRRHSLGQFFRFSVVGTGNFLLDYLVYFALTRGFDFWARHIIMAASVSFVAAVISSFFFNTFWTFRCDGSGWHKRGLKFITVATGGLALNALILFALTSLGVYDLVAKVAATAIVLVWNFYLQKKWTFGL